MTKGKLLSFGVVALILLGAQSCLPTYSCGDSHCYGQIRSQDTAPPISRFTVTLDTPQLVAPKGPGGQGHISDEMWLSQRTNPLCNCLNPPTCTESGQFGCWVEVGIGAQENFPDPNVAHYFWADNRPGLGYLFHDIGPVPTAQFGQAVTLEITRLDGLPPNSLFAYLDTGTTAYGGVSSNNTMTPVSTLFGL